jgi:hypothetical protein
LTGSLEIIVLIVVGGTRVIFAASATELATQWELVLED